MIINVKNVAEEEREMVEYIAEAIIEEAKLRQQSQRYSDLVAAIHNTWMEVGLLLGKEMSILRSKEKENLNQNS